jgi:hypothetical protein
VGYSTFTFKDTEEFKDRQRVDDQEIIPWCGAHNAIWIHADDNAKVEHKKLMEENQVKSIWVYRPKGVMSSKDQLPAISYGLPRALGLLKRYQHVEIRVKGQPPQHGYSIKPLLL